MNVLGKEKKKLKLPHWLPFVASLLGVLALMALYIWFVGSWFGKAVPAEERLAEFREYAESVGNDIAALSEHDMSLMAEGDTNTYQIFTKGDEQELRDAVFKGGAYQADSCMSNASGKRCCRYFYNWYELECIIIYDKGGAELHTDGTELSAAVGDDITVAVRGHEKL